MTRDEEIERLTAERERLVKRIALLQSESVALIRKGLEDIIVGKTTDPTREGLPT